MTAPTATDRTMPSPARLVIGLSLAAVMLVLASCAVGVFLVAPLEALDDPSDDARPIQIVAVALAVVLFVGTGPVTYLVSRRRWTLALPLAVLVVWGLGVVVAAAT